MPIAKRPLKGIETYLALEGLMIGGNYNQFMYRMERRLCQPKEIKEAFAKASPSEREGIVAFVNANKNKEAVKGRNKYWYLIPIRNLDSGRKVLCAGYSREEIGMPTKQFLALPGLA